MRDAPASPHALSPADVLAALGVTAGGLSSDEAAARLAASGPNRLPDAPRRPAILRFLAQFANVLIYVLLAAAGVTAVLGHPTDTVVILAVVLVNACVGYVQEGRAEAAMDALRGLLAPRAAALRDGTRRTLDAAALVPGDIVLLEAGDRVPADLRLLGARGLRIDEALLTGESVPADKATPPVPADAPLGDRASMAFSGSLVTAGTGRGVVVATGQGTEIGRIGRLLGEVRRLETPLVAQMDAFARALTALILIASAALLAYGTAVGHQDFEAMFMVVVGLAVAAIPEGLPAVLTITLAAGARAMARRNAIVRRLPAIETVGAVSVICTDKTGTLTRNEMLVASVTTAAGTHEVTGEGYAPEGTIAPALPPWLAALPRAAALCNDAHLAREGGAGPWRAEGDPMEAALLAFALKAGAARDGARRLDAIPFDAAHRYMAVLAQGPDASRAAWVKGAPERVIDLCATLATAAGPVPLDRAAWHAAAHAVARRGQRVLALAIGPAPPGDSLDESHLPGTLTLLGLVGLIDPPRPEAVAAVAECRAAGIAVKMITGDHAGTAEAIARAIGLDGASAVLTGAEIDRLGDADLAAAALSASVFARTSPRHKLRLVAALQSRGLIVAMTGDGVNDAPALRRADVGIAMGRKGSEAAKDAADLVLADDDFASIAAAVREGRTVWDNLRKVIGWTLPTNAGETATIVVAILLGLALPVTAVQILWINLVTAATLGLALAFEPPEPGVMARPPRPRNAPLLPPSLVWHVVLVSALFLAAVFGLAAHAADRGHPPALVRTMVMDLIVALEIVHLFFVRNLHSTSLTWAAVRGTPAVWLCLAIVVPAQVAATWAPPLQALLGTVPVPPADGLLILAVAAVFFAIIEAEKQVRLALAARA